MAERVCCPRCGAPFASGELTCPRDGSARPGPARAKKLEEQQRLPPELDEEPRTEQVDASDFRAGLHPRISLQPELLQLRKLPGVPSGPQPAYRPNSGPGVAPSVSPALRAEEEDAPETEKLKAAVPPGRHAATTVAPAPVRAPAVIPPRRTPTSPEEKLRAAIPPRATPPATRRAEPRPSAEDVHTDKMKIADDKLIGRKVGDYVIQERIGSGGMGVVYRGLQPLIGATVAIKVLRPEAAGDPQQVARLLSEARVVNAIRHRGIVDIFNFAELPDGRHCVVMELLSGHSLEELIQKQGRLSLEEALPLFEECLAALSAAHKAGVIHRDLKPSNIFVVQEHGLRYAKLLDFGIAKQSYAADGLVAQTVMTRFMGTPGFVAPEQARAQPVGPLTDLYALGVVMFLALTGRPPFEAATAYELVRMHVEHPPPRPSSFEKSIPAGLDALLLSMMGKTSQDRPQSADIVRERLVQLRLALSAPPSAPVLDSDGVRHTAASRPLRTEPPPRVTAEPQAQRPDQTVTTASERETPMRYALLAAGAAVGALAAWYLLF